MSNAPAKNPAAVALGRLGGKARSERKTLACRRNARKGGWKKGKKRAPYSPEFVEACKKVLTNCKANVGSENPQEEPCTNERPAHE